MVTVESVFWFVRNIAWKMRLFELFSNNVMMILFVLIFWIGLIQFLTMHIRKEPISSSTCHHFCTSVHSPPISLKYNSHSDTLIDAHWFDITTGRCPPSFSLLANWFFKPPELMDVSLTCKVKGKRRWLMEHQESSIIIQLF